MVIKASSAREIGLLVDALVGPDPVKRDAAAARLSVIGPRSVERLAAAYARVQDEQARLQILRVLETIGDTRAATVAHQALADGGGLAIAATQILRGLLDAADDAVRGAALDALVTAALDEHAERRVRLSAADALRGVADDVRTTVAVALGDKGEAGPGNHAESPDAADEGALWAAALEGRLPEHAETLGHHVNAHAHSAPLAKLQGLIDALRTRESGDDAEEWRAVRGRVHQALAQRGSRIAFYDLKESLSEARAPLPVSFLSAVHTIGDSSCLEPLAQAYSHAATPEEWWRQQLASAFRAVMTREKLTRRSAPVKRVLAKWPGMSGGLGA